MSTFIVMLIVISGLLAVPSYYLTEYAGKMVHTPTTRNKTTWRAVRCISGVYSMLAVVVWGVFVAFGLTALGLIGIHGERFDRMIKDYPELYWLLQPLAPFIGPPMLVIALVISPFLRNPAPRGLAV
jgi:hypothetical protein